MTIIVDRDALHAAVSFAERRAKGNSIPILGHLLLRTEANRLTVMGHSLDACAEAAVPAECQPGIAFTVPAKSLSSLLSGARAGATITIKPDATIAQIQFGKSRYRLPVLPAADFPGALTVENAAEIELSTETIDRLFRPCAKIVDATNPNPAYTGIYLHMVGDTLAAAACDGHQLLRACSDERMTALPPPIILPLGAIDEICRLAGDGGKARWSDRLFSITAGDKTFTTKLVAATFPDYTRIIPETDGPFLEFDREEAVDAITRLSCLSDARGLMNIEWADNPSTLAMSFRANGEGQEEIECSPSEMAASGFAAPPWQLLRLLECLDVDRVRFHIDDPRKPFRISAPSRPDILAMQVPCYIAGKQQEAA